MLLHWWRRRDDFEIGERLQRLRDLTEGSTLRVQVKYAEPSEKVRPRVKTRLHLAERRKTA